MKSMKQMQYHAGIQMRFYPSEKQREIVSKNDGAQRFVYNRMVAINQELFRWKQITIPVGFIQERISLLEQLRDSVSFLQSYAPFLYDRDIDSQAIANGKQNYQKAWNQYRKVPGTGIPTFHKKGYEKSYQTNPHYSGSPNKCNVHFVDRKHITLPILGSCKVKGSPTRMQVLRDRTAAADDSFIRIGTITVSMDACGDYFISMQIASDKPIFEVLPKTNSAVGIDMNIENFYTDSNGNVVDNPQYKRSMQKELGKAQKVMSRRAVRAKKENRPLQESKNYQKARAKVANIHRRIERRRTDFEHTESKKLIKNHDFIFAEELKVSNMLKNHRIAYSVADVSWFQFCRMLDYKADAYGKLFLQVPASYTTQTCHACGYILAGDQKLSLADREWTCPCCGTFHLRDHNAAINILNKGLPAVCSV